MNLFENVALPLFQRFDCAITPPIPVGEKHPAEKYAHRRRHATLTEIIEWAEENANCNYGIFAGNIDGRGGFVILESDDEEGESAIREHCGNTPFRVKTRKGWHHYYRYPVEIPYIVSRAKLTIAGKTVNVDIRASKGLVVGPGSHWEKDGQSGTYEMVGDWFSLSLSDMPVFDLAWVDTFLTPDQDNTPTAVEDYVIGTLTDRQEQAQDYLRRQKGTKKGNNADNICLAIASTLVNGFALSENEAIDLFTEWGQRNDQLNDQGGWYPWSRAELMHKLTDAQGDPENRPRGYMLKPSDDELRKVFDCDYGVVKPEEKMNLDKRRVATGREFRELAAKDRIDWLVQDRIEMGGFSIFSGKPYGGKSVVVAHLIGCCLTGKDFFGSPVKQCHVLYIDTDRNRISRTYNRIARLAPDDAIDARFHFTLVDELPDTLTDDALLGLCQETVTHAPEKVNHLFVIVDTFRSALLTGKEKGAESDSAVIMNILKPFKRLVRKTKITLMVLHHDPKYSGEIAGSGAIPGVTDGVWGYGEVPDKPYRKLTIRTRDDKDIDPLRLVYHVEGGLKVATPDDDESGYDKAQKKKEADQQEREEVCSHFPATVDQALTYEQIAEIPFFAGKGEKAIRACLERCEQACVHPRLNKDGKGKKGDPYRWFRV